MCATPSGGKAIDCLHDAVSKMLYRWRKDAIRGESWGWMYEDYKEGPTDFTYPFSGGEPRPVGRDVPGLGSSGVGAWRGGGR